MPTGLNRIHLTLLCLLFCLLCLVSCSTQGGEEVVSRYPSGHRKETQIFTGSGSNKARLKVFEYYEGGEKKKEYNFKDGLFHGPFTYWYKNGDVFCRGMIENKAINLTMVTGTETYYWPGGKKMLAAQTVKGQMKPGTHFIYWDEDGKEYTEQTRPAALLEKTKAITDHWEKGEI